MTTNILFPSKFRLCAFAIILLLILSAVLSKVFNWTIADEQLKELVFFISNGLMCLALFLIQFSRYSDDDEMLMEIRLRLVLSALLVAIIYLVIAPLLEFFVFKDEVSEIPASQIIMVMLFFQIFMLQMKRYALRKELRKAESL